MTDAVSVKGAKSLAAALSGKFLRIPNFKSILSDWLTGPNKHINQDRAIVDQMLEGTIEDEKKLKALKACDFRRASWFPDNLDLAATYTVWIYLWDDYVDHGENDS
ncbi:hypothetical protein HRG_014412 [Hirsutella rhossiliensis]